MSKKCYFCRKCLKFCMFTFGETLSNGAYRQAMFTHHIVAGGRFVLLYGKILRCVMDRKFSFSSSREKRFSNFILSLIYP